MLLRRYFDFWTFTGHPLGNRNRHRRRDGRRRSRGNSEEDLDLVAEYDNDDNSTNGYGTTGKMYACCVLFYEMTTTELMCVEEDGKYFKAKESGASRMKHCSYRYSDFY